MEEYHITFREPDKAIFCTGVNIMATSFGEAETTFNKEYPNKEILAILKKLKN